MRHFLWFYIQVMTNESEGGERLRQSIRQKASEEVAISAETALLKKCRTATDAELIRYLSEGKSPQAKLALDFRTLFQRY